MQITMVILGVCAVILVVIFKPYRTLTTEVGNLPSSAQMPMVLVLLISILFGLLIGFLSSLPVHAMMLQPSGDHK